MPSTISPYLTLPLRTLSEVLRARAERTAVQLIGRARGVTAEIVDFPSRRGFMRIGAALAGATTIAASPNRALAHGNLDPLIALGAERERLVERINAPGPVDDVSDAESELEHRELCNIEDQIEALAPISAAGAIALVRFIQYRRVVFNWDERDDKIADNLIAGLRALAAGGAS
jgi:hypothetical protein